MDEGRVGPRTVAVRACQGSYAGGNGVAWAHVHAETRGECQWKVRAGVRGVGARGLTSEKVVQ